VSSHDEKLVGILHARGQQLSAEFKGLGVQVLQISGKLVVLQIRVHLLQAKAAMCLPVGKAGVDAFDRLER